MEYTPTKAPYDPKLLLEGRPGSGSREWEAGFFDRGSFTETLGNWAMTVITGRARLGGIPCGVIAVETRSVECIVPADPANVDSESRVSHTLTPSPLSPPHIITSTNHNSSLRLSARRARYGTQIQHSRQPRPLKT